jgi:hypothetical protein
MPERKSVTDFVVDAWVASNRGMACWHASHVCRGMQMRYQQSDGNMVTCVVESIGPLTKDGRPSSVTISFEDEAGRRRERNTVFERLFKLER